MAVDGSLNFDTSIDTKGFSNGTKSISNSLGGLKSALGKVAVAVAAAFSVKQIIDFGKQAIETASDMAEVQNVVDTAFGSMSYKMEEFANNSIKQFGISKLAAKQTGSTFMAMASGMGLAVDNASDMAIALTGLSADMASFYNVSQEVASTALKSIFTGETETLKQFGIVMTDANLQAYALSQGINKSTQNMSQAEKVQLRYNYVMQQTALAQGDFAKTQDSWANQTRILTEQWKEFGATVGNLLMSVFLPAIKTLNNVLSQLISYADSAFKALANVFGIKLNNNSSGAGQLANDTSQLADDSSQAADNYSDMAESAEEAQKADEKSLASFDKINKLSDNTSKNTKSKVSTPAINTGNSLAGKTGTVKVKADVEISEAQKKIQKFLESVKKALSRLFEPIQKAWDKYGAQVIRTMKTAFGEIWDLIKSIGKSFMNVWTNGTGTEILEHLLSIFANINTLIGNIAKSFRTAWNADNIGTDIVQDMADILNTILKHIDNISKKCSDWAKTLDFKPLLNAFDELLQAVEPFMDNIGEGLEWFFNNVLLPLASWTIEDAIPTFLTTLSDVISGLSSAWDTAAPVIEDKLWKGFLQPIAKWTGGAALSLLKTLGKAVKDIGESITKEQVDVLIDLSGAVGAIILAVKGKKYVDDFVNSLKNLGSNAGTALSGFSKTMTTDISKSAEEGGASFGTKFMASAGALLAGWQIGSAIRDAIGGDTIDNALFPIIDKFMELRNIFVSRFQTLLAFPGEFAESLQETMDSIYDSISGLWNSVSTFFTETIPDAISMFIESLQETMDGIYDSAVNMWNNIVSFFTESIPAFFTETVPGFFSDLWESIKETFKDVKDWFKKKFESAGNGIKEAFSSIGSFFSGIWDKVKKPFVDAGKWFKEKFNDVVDGIGSAFNRISDIVKKPVNWIIDGINTIIRGLNSMSFDVPDWVPGIGGNSFGINIPEIPRLATGAVIPPNKEFLAVLGDQKSGTNIEAPLETIKQAVAEVMAVYGGSGNQKISLTIPLILRNKTISQVVIDDINDYIRRNGTSPIGG